MDSSNKFRNCDLPDYFKYLLEYVNVLDSTSGFDSLKRFIHDDMILFILANRVAEGEHRTVLYRYILENVRIGRVSQEMLDKIFPETPYVASLIDFSGLKNSINDTKLGSWAGCAEDQEWLDRVYGYATVLHNNPFHPQLFEWFVEHLAGRKDCIGCGSFGIGVRNKIKLAVDEGHISESLYLDIFPTSLPTTHLSDLKNNIEREWKNLNIPESSKVVPKTKTVEKADKKEEPQQEYSVIVVSDGSNLFQSLKFMVRDDPKFQGVQVFDGNRLDPGKAKNIILGIYDIKYNKNGCWAQDRMTSLIWPTVKVIRFRCGFTDFISDFTGISNTDNPSEIMAYIKSERDNFNSKKFNKVITPKSQNPKLEKANEQIENDKDAKKYMWIGVDSLGGSLGLTNRVCNTVNVSNFRIGTFDSIKNWGEKTTFFIIDIHSYCRNERFIERLLEVIPGMVDGGQILYLKSTDLAFSSLPLDDALEKHNIQLKRISALEDIEPIIKKSK